ncbi:heavy metal translocating P-type ATPase [Microbacterium sp. zg.Y1090]|uniref:heavy metal translocating P-type ATPase n=1 Tax=Microbacterium TaxID=33882 RepID=UPI00214B24C0|nr:MULTISPECIES: heavy metal translocating P-type ATPase [unclassified Microbacterium]MCR2811604.1 heavy metal translocating P-type ATPase [Microbacterium sp. zg.Y1084]MCR2818974.1 heavy metal translocating P-type ATPase [Microbacterium sp. zg.Y1090]MDL5487624.1 heavy metal translocating P-type ATPase [Microbacterium sp. zg-Y1211]WIM27279.1 heavy metal translocating P-type ATPase [Microbacterium sp. zg-Y1090]
MTLRTVGRYGAIVLSVVALGVVLALAAGGADGAARVVATVYVAAFVVFTLVRMVRDVLQGHVGLDILAVVAMVATLAVGEYVASLIIVLMLSGGEALEEFAARRAQRDLTALLDRSPRTAHIVTGAAGTDGEQLRDVPVDDVEIGDLLVVRPSEVVPVDGVVVGDAGTFDESSLTGESLPVTRADGEEVYSGAVNGTRAVRLRAVRRSADSQYQQIVALVEAAQTSRAPIVRLADRFAVPFTAVSLVLAGTAWALSGDSTRFAEVLVLATPCPLLLAAPIAFLGGLSRAAKSGIIVKGGAQIERLARVRSVCFDKTGTLTAGRPELVDVLPAPGFTADEVLQLAASAEQYSSHVLAEGIRAAADARGLALLPAQEASEVATNGVSAVLAGRQVAVGKAAFVAGVAGAVERPQLQPGQVAAYVAVDGRFAGALLLADAAREESRDVVAWLRTHGIERVAMLTGDAAPTAEAIAHRLGIDEVHADLLPPEKVHLVASFTPRPTMMVGDGINDAPALAASDIGVAMGARGATAAGDAADVVITVDSLARVAEAVVIGRHTLRVALTAIWIGIGLSVALMIVAMTGVIPAVVGALVQELVDLATILYALRALRAPASGIPASSDAPTPTAAPPRAP